MIKKRYIYSIISIGLCLSLIGCYSSEQSKSSPSSVVANSQNNNHSQRLHLNTVILPVNIQTYRQAMINYSQVGGINPFNNSPFVVKKLPKTIKPSLQNNIQFVIDSVISPTYLSAGKITYLLVKNHIAYIELEMNNDGWAGVSSTIAVINPLVVKNLLRDPNIHQVIFHK
ncbi:hypothetical protein [Photobacterium carnosum]|uniref:Uncharacterized protein n=1 Tax=Photobacterium carnosum TaxID=2023717 RepID=A0A2N4UMD8_9GAMM|nr:hypothetical protein [Photobacterium carnosum]MBY3787639.1 hypothetical protein [Photobacterium carnosum]MCD9515550.1 hypothetical protein [Photobacterium carnosum]MCD9532269.1 hypothetical protein [Photobacterium carnosum]PLC56201.1 hypothetical protein CIK00_19635 [Photobacterium carnosum]